MTILKVVKYPDPILRRKSSSVESIDDNIRKLMDDMLETLYSLSAVGLAAVQVGILKKIFVVDISENKDKPEFFINPIIKYISQDKIKKKEGCLSFSGYAEVPRCEEIEVEYLDYEGNKKILRADGFLAQAIQHENDHLEGIVYTDHLPMIKKMLIHQKTLKESKKTLSEDN